MTLVRKFRAHPCRKSLLEVVCLGVHARRLQVSDALAVACACLLDVGCASNRLDVSSFLCQ
jgi:hypothetical protein